MLKNISKIKGSKVLHKQSQKNVLGGGGFFPPCRQDGDGCALIVNGYLTAGVCMNGQCVEEDF